MNEFIKSLDPQAQASLITVIGMLATGIITAMLAFIGVCWSNAVSIKKTKIEQVLSSKQKGLNILY